jgi:hypothetical protein
MQTRNHVRTLVLGAALALSAGIPGSHAFAAAPNTPTHPRPTAPATGSATPLEVHSTGEPGGLDESQCQAAGQRLNNDLTQIKWAAYQGDADRVGYAWAMYTSEMEFARRIAS